MQTKSSGSAKVTFFDRDAVWRATQELAATLAIDHPEIRSIKAFGSIVRGRAVPGSDVDLLIEVESSGLDFKDRADVFRPTGFPTALDIFVYTRAELQAMLAEGNMFLRRALSEAIILHPLDAH